MGYGLVRSKLGSFSFPEINSKPHNVYLNTSSGLPLWFLLAQPSRIQYISITKLSTYDPSEARPINFFTFSVHVWIIFVQSDPFI
jgi:hypothetical protein